MPFPNWIGKQRFWTRERVIAALAGAMKQIKGPLPCRDDVYNQIKKGKLDWPCSRRILEYFHSMGRAWLAAGAPRRRVRLFNVDWTEEEKEYVLEHAGTYTLKRIAGHLRRTYSGIRGELRTVGIASRHNQGFMSAAEIAKEYGCPYHRVCVMLAARVLPGRYDGKRNRWRVDPGRISPALEMLLRAPKVTHKSWPTDRGDYYKRHGLCRRVVDGKVVVVDRLHPRAGA
jgi:hypothetical protein